MEALAWAAGTHDLRARKDYRGYGQAGTPGRFVCRPAQQPWSATSDLYPLQPDRACRLWREISSGAPHFDQPGGIRGQFLGCEKDGQKPANALVPLGRSSHAAGQSGDGERQSTTTAPAQARPAYAAPPPDLSTNPAFAQSSIKPQSFCRSLWNGGTDHRSHGALCCDRAGLSVAQGEMPPAIPGRIEPVVRDGETARFRCRCRRPTPRPRPKSGAFFCVKAGEPRPVHIGAEASTRTILTYNANALHCASHRC